MVFASYVKQIAWVELNQYTHWIRVYHSIAGIEIAVGGEWKVLYLSLFIHLLLHLFIYLPSSL